MTAPIHWDDVARAAAAALASVAPGLPAPASAVAAVAAVMVGALTDLGCTVLDCDEPSDVPRPADLPTGAEGRAAYDALRRRAAGLDRESIEARLRPTARPSVAIADLRAAARGPTERETVDRVLLRAAGHG